MSDENKQRRQPRYETRRRLWCEGQEQGRFGETHNISQGGMFIVADEETEIGQHVKLSFDEGDEKIALEVEVMWTGEHAGTGAKGVGVRIVDFGSSKDVYQRFVQKLEEETSGDSENSPSESSAPAAADKTNVPSESP